MTDYDLDHLLFAAFGHSAPEPDTGHLTEEQIAALVGPSSTAGLDHAHLSDCRLCQMRLALAAELLPIDAIDHAARSIGRIHRLSPLIASALSADQSPARLRVTLGEDSSVRLCGHGVEMRIRDQPRAALRRSGDDSGWPGVHPISFRRRFGALDVLLQLVPTEAEAPGDFDLHLELAGRTWGRCSAHLYQSARLLLARPLRGGRCAFSDVGAGAYELTVEERRITVGRFLLDVERSGA